MRYKEFSFEKYKGIQRMTLDLTGDVTTLIGLNESGKTTILEAIYCFEYGAEHLDAINPEIASVHDRSKWIPIPSRANFSDTIKIAATVTLDALDRLDLREFLRQSYGLSASYIQSTIKVTEHYEFANSRFAKKGQNTWGFKLEGTKGRERKPRPYNAKTPEWQGAVRFLIERMPKILYFPNFLFELPARFLLTDPEDQGDDPWSVPTDEEVDKNKFYRNIFDEIIRQTVEGATLQTLIERLTSTRRDDQRSLLALTLEMNKSVTKTVFDGWNRIFGRAASADQEVEINAKTDPKDGPYLELQIKTPDGYYDLSERSIGFRWFFTFLLMTTFHGSTPSRSKPLFLLDEPASNLHSTAQAELLKSFENLLDRCSLVYATHSHHLINLRWLDSAYVVRNAALGSFEMSNYLDIRLGYHTSISAVKYRRFLTQHPNQTAYIQPVLDVLGYQRLERLLVLVPVRLIV